MIKFMRLFRNASKGAMLAGMIAAVFPSVSNAAMEWSGFFSVHYSNEVFEESDKNPGKDSFDSFELALIPRVDITPDLDLYAQIIFEHGGFFESERVDTADSETGRLPNARSSGELTLNDAFITYTFNQMFKVRAGKFAVPYGLWNTLMYATPSYITIRQPGRESVYSRGETPVENSNLFGRYNMGLWLLGEIAPISYDIYIANGRTLNEDHEDDNQNKAVGGRLHGAVDIGPSKLKLMYSRYQDQLHDSLDPSSPFIQQNTDVFSLEFSVHGLGIISEYAMSKRGTVSKEAYYGIVQYTLLEKWTPYAQYETFDPNTDGSVKGDRLTTTSAGVAFHIVPWATMIKLQVDMVDREDPPAAKNANSTKYWLGFATAL